MLQASIYIFFFGGKFEVDRSFVHFKEIKFQILRRKIVSCPIEFLIFNSVDPGITFCLCKSFKESRFFCTFAPLLQASVGNIIKIQKQLQNLDVNIDIFVETFERFYLETTLQDIDKYNNTK